MAIDKRKKAAARPKSGRAAAEKRPDEKLVEKTLELLERHDRAVAGSKREVGRHVLEAYFGGDEKLARSRSPRKAVSYRRLEERAPIETSWDARGLYEAVRIELAARTLPEEIANAIDASYLLRLATIDDLERRREIAARIAREGLRGEAVTDLIAEHAGEERLGGRARTPEPILAVARIERLLEWVRGRGALDRRAIAALPAEERASLKARVAPLREALSTLLEAV